MQDSLFWHRRLQAILSEPSYHAREQNSSWLQTLFGLLAKLVRQLHLHMTVGPPPRSIGWIVLALSAVGLTLLLSQFRRNRSAKAETAPRVYQQPIDAAGWFRLADQHVAASEYHEAARCYFLASVNHLQSVRELNVNPNKTNGEYAQELLRRRSPVSGPFLALARACDELLYQNPDGSGEALVKLSQSLADTARASASLIMKRERAPS